MGGLSQRQVSDERRDVDAADRAPVLGPNFGQVGGADNLLTAIAGPVVVDAAFDRAQQCRFPVIAAADDEGYAGGDAHAVHGPGVGQGKGDAQAFAAR